MLDGFRASGARLSEGAPLPSGGRLRVALGGRAAADARCARARCDHLILGRARRARQRTQDDPTIFVTKDVNLRIRADALGLNAEDYDAERIDIDELYSGMTELDVPGADVDAFYAQGDAAADRGRR